MGGLKIPNDVGATVFAILSGLAALFLTAWIFGTGGCTDTKNPSIAPVPDSGDNSALAEAREALDEESARRAELAMKLEELKSKNGELNAELSGLKGEIESKNALLDAKLKNEAKLKAGADLQAKLKAAREANGKLKANLDGLKAEFEGTKGDLSAKIADLEAKLAALTDEKKALSLKMQGEAKSGADLDKLKAELAALALKLKTEGKATADAKLALDAKTKAAAEKEKALNAEIAKLKANMSGDANKLSADLEALKKAAAGKEKTLNVQITTLKGEIDGLKKKLAADAKACADAKKKLMAEIESLKAELTNAKFGDKLKPAAANLPELKLPMLVNDPAKLHANIQPLFLKLRETADNPEALEKAYAEITKEGNSTPRLRIPFDVGSDEIGAEDAKKLAAELNGADKKLKFLAVGYASSDGDAKSNYELSSRRASRVAEEIAKITGVGADQIQAVYFGQTKRFNSKYLSPNRIVEVWTVK